MKSNSSKVDEANEETAKDLSLKWVTVAIFSVAAFTGLIAGYFLHLGTKV